MVRIAVVGAGRIGRRHASLVAAQADCTLAAIVDPALAAGELAQSIGVPWHASLEELLAREAPDGVVLATPNALHVDGALACIAAGIPTLVEKPLAHTIEGALAICEAAEAADVPVLVGHHRRHSAIMARAVEVVRSGALGSIVAYVGTALFHKPDSYFEGPNAWRTQPGGGPILINMIHEIDSARALCGEVAAVQAICSRATRGFAVEDTAAISMRFVSGALGTFALSDAACSDRSWEHTSGEDPAYAKAHAKEDCCLVVGTEGSLAIPTMRLTRYLRPEDRSWHEAFDRSVVPIEPADPLQRQLAHFVRVVRREARPLVGPRDGLANVRVVDAIARAAQSGCAICP
jgi:predicted dehydrogenase